MYVPKHFALDDRGSILALIRSYPFAALVTQPGDGFNVTHIPTVIKPDDGDHGAIECHLSRANPQWRELVEGAPALMIFSGPQAYVTPAWYPAKAEHGKVVPTWNYAVVHAHGRAEAVDDRDWLVRHVAELSDQEEAGNEAPWSTSDAPETYITALSRGIVGVRLVIDQIEAKAKMSQNRPEHDRDGVANGLSSRGRDGDAVVGNWVQSRNP
ncbi:MAG: FMN-binding negative transcriptional regulator [Pseudomonadota bacterium]